MEIKIGIVNVAREVTIEVEESAQEVTQRLAEALQSGGLLSLADAKGRTVHVPAAQIGYLDCGKEHARPVGFGTI